MRKILGTLVATISVVAAMLVLNTGIANADVIGHYGHKDTYWDINGNITYDTSPTRAFRVGVETRTLSAPGSSTPTAVDVNVCITPIYLERIARVSINEIWLLKDNTNVRDVVDQVVGDSPYTLCHDLDPNVSAVCGPSRSSNYQGFAYVGVRRTDGVLLTKLAASNNAALPCD